MSEQTTNKENTTKDIAQSEGNTAKPQQTTEDQSKKAEKKKKKGFFEKWRESTAKGYEKYRAAGGNF